MRRPGIWLSAFAVLVLGAAGWWFSQCDTPSPEMNTTGTTFSKDKSERPHFKPRSARYAPLSPDSETPQPDQDTVELVYPEGLLLSCPAPDLDDGAYQVLGSTLRHLRATNGQLVGVLKTPSEGEGFLMTTRGHPVAEFRWTEELCQVASLTPLTLPGVVVDADGDPVADTEVVGCVGDLMTTKEDGSFQMKILSGQSCWPFAFRDDDDGFAKGKMVEAIGGETEHVELPSPGASTSAANQRKQLEQGAHQLITFLEKQYAGPSPVAETLEEHPDNPVIRTWADEEVELLNERYEEVEFLLSGDATEDDWRDIWLFGLGA